jgi:hypothetical protein
MGQDHRPEPTACPTADREGLTVSIWFEGKNEIDCSLEQVKSALGNHGDLYVGVTGLMPGLTTVELVEQGSDAVTIRTNEGLMKRTNISKRVEAGQVVVDFDEQYAAGSGITVTSHYTDEFSTSGTGVAHRVVISDVEAPGFLGFFYRRFGSSKMGNAFLTANQASFEQQAE